MSDGKVYCVSTYIRKRGKGGGSYDVKVQVPAPHSSTHHAIYTWLHACEAYYNPLLPLYSKRKSSYTFD